MSCPECRRREGLVGHVKSLLGRLTYGMSVNKYGPTQRQLKLFEELKADLAKQREYLETHRLVCNA